MRQVWISRVGPPDVLIVKEAPLPSPMPGQVRIAVEAMGVNFADIVGRLGLYTDAPKIPYIPGYEVTGHIDALGAGVDASYLGTAVTALTRFGGYSEFVCVPAKQTFPRPATMPVEQAAGFPVAFLTAYEGLVALGGIKPGEHVLIHAAAGGLGQAAVEIAKIVGTTIYGTASPQKHDFLRERGVHHPINYRDFEQEIQRLTNGQGVQVALDSIGGRSWMKSYRALSPTGRLVITGVTSLTPSQNRSLRAILTFALTTPWLAFNPVRLTSDNKGVVGVNMGHMWGQEDRVQTWAEQLLAWYSEGTLNVAVDRVFKLEKAAAAHVYIQERRNKGKVILVP